MSYQSVRDDLARRASDLTIIEAQQSTATVVEAAQALGVTPGQIAKTLALRVNDQLVLVVARGDARLDNCKAKAALGGKPRMLDAEQTLAITGHPVGGVSPFGLLSPLPVYCDISLRAFATVFPAAGSLNTSVEVGTERLAALLDAQWVDVCSTPAGG